MKSDDLSVAILILLAAVGLLSYLLVSTQIAITRLDERQGRITEQQANITERLDNARDRQNRMVEALDNTYNILQEHLREEQSRVRNIPLLPWPTPPSPQPDEPKQ